MPPDFPTAPLKLDRNGANAFKIPRKRHFKLRILHPAITDKLKTAEVNRKIRRLTEQKTPGESPEQLRVLYNVL